MKLRLYYMTAGGTQPRFHLTRKRLKIGDAGYSLELAGIIDSHRYTVADSCFLDLAKDDVGDKAGQFIAKCDASKTEKQRATALTIGAMVACYRL